MIKVDDKLPAGRLQEYIEVEGNGSSIVSGWPCHLESAIGA